MNTIKCNLSNSTITPDYCEETNTLEISIGDKNGFRFVHLDRERADYLLDLITEFKSMVV